MKNYLSGFSDRSLNFSTSCIYLVSCDVNSNKYHTILIITMSKLVKYTQTNKSEEFTPGKEMHGLWLAASNMMKAIQDIRVLYLPLEAAYIGVDALSQVMGLTRPPTY